MRVWVTRTRPGADRTAERLRAMGHEPVVAPVLEMRPLPWTPDLTGVGALAFTSAHAVRRFAEAAKDRALPVFAVGDATAAAACAAGFADVRSAAGDVRTLAASLCETAPFGGAVLHVGGRPLAGDLVGALTRAGVPARAVAVYETTPTDVSRPPDIEAALAHSPQAARRLVALGPPDLLFACISEAAAAPLREAGAARVDVAARPDEAALLAVLP